MAVRDLIREFEFASPKVRKLEEALKTNEDKYDSLKTANDLLTRGNSEFREKIVQDYQSERKIMVENHKREKEHLENQMALLENKHKNSTKEEVTRMKMDCDNQIRQSHNSLTEYYEKQLQTLHYQHEEEKRQIYTQESQIKREFHIEKARLLSVIESKNDAFESLRAEHDNNWQRMTTEHQAVKDRIVKRCEDETALLKNSLQELEGRHREKIHSMQSQHIQDLHQKNLEIEEVKKQQEAKERRLEGHHAAEKLKLEKEKEEEHRQLRGNFEVLMGAMVNRDRFKIMSDRGFALGFQDLANEIDFFSRVRWDNKREVTWPFPDRAFRKVENERRSKQHVIQNTIWVILYERIFCTPFRVPIFLIRQLNSTRFEVSGGPCTLSKAHQSF